MDPLFRVECLNATPNPQRTCWWAMHQDYSERFVFDEDPPDETRAGEIIVKRLLAGNRGHYGCYSADTSVMTSEGWKPWPEVTQNDQLLAVDIQTGEGHFEHPQSLYSQPLRSGDFLYAMSSQRLDQLVTHDHRMIVSRRTSAGKWTKFAAYPTHEIAGKAVRYRVTAELAEQDRRLPVDRPRSCSFLEVLRIAGFYYGDGVRSCNQQPQSLRFHLRLPQKIAYIQKHGSTVGSVVTGISDRYTLHCGPIAEWIERHFGSSTGKTVPKWLIRLPRPELLAFLDGLRHSDGTRFKASTAQGGPSWALDSCEKKALEIIQAAAVLNGIACSLTLNNPNEGPGHEKHRPCWRLHFSHDRPYARFEVHQGRTSGEEGVSSYEGYVYCATVSTGALLVSRNGKSVISGNCLEHPQITFNVGFFPHSVMQQARTHRIGCSFDVQSMRYTGQRVCAAARGEMSLEDVFYLRPAGSYSDRQGKRYVYTDAQRWADKGLLQVITESYASRVEEHGFAEEHARGLLAFDVRQHFVVSFSLRALLHFLDLRAKLDAQQEIRWLCDLMLPHLQSWAPEVADWYINNRLHKAKLAP